MYAEKKDLKRRMDFKNSASCDLISRNFEEEQAVRHSGRDFREPSSTASVGTRFSNPPAVSQGYMDGAEYVFIGYIFCPVSVGAIAFTPGRIGSSLPKSGVQS
jgi:hypothetical protein